MAGPNSIREDAANVSDHGSRHKLSNHGSKHKVSDHRAASIREELEQFLALGDSSDEHEEFATEALNGESREKFSRSRSNSRKNLHKQRSIRRRHRRENSHRDVMSTSRSSKGSTDDSLSNDEPSPSSKSPKPNRSSKESRKIKYNRSKEPETEEERDRDARSLPNLRSKAKSLRRKESHRRLKRAQSSERITRNDKGAVVKEDEANWKSPPSGRSKRISHRKRETSSEAAEDKDGKDVTAKKSESRRRSWVFDDFENEDNFLSSQEFDEEVEVGLNDEDSEDGEDNPSTESGGGRKGHPRRSPAQESKPTERRIHGGGLMKRSSSMGKLKGKGSLDRASSTGRMTASNHSADGDSPSQWPSFRRPTSRRPAGVMNVENALGDPSRKANPSRTKANEIPSAGDRKGLPPRSKSNDFAEFLHHQGLPRKQYSEHSGIEVNEDDDKDNPFEVTYQSYSIPDAWDPFASEDSAEEKLEDTKERRGNLRPTKSGNGLIRTSSKDTISRLRVGAIVTNISNLPADGVDAKTELEKQREKQRRADYKKSIAAAAMAGRRRSNTTSRSTHRQARTVHSSFEESVKQLEGALQRTRIR